MLNEDCYRLLNIGPDADEKTIRKAYRDRSKELHPDVNPSPDAAQQFAKLSAAMHTLIDPTERLKHDDRFGYNKTTRNQDANAKQKFSDFQKEKAEHLVKEWSSDYEKAMMMREAQRMQVVKAHQQRKKVIILAIAVLLAFIISMIVYVMSFDIPDQR
jgi:DnaJ-class molecular chaperone